MKLSLYSPDFTISDGDLHQSIPTKVWKGDQIEINVAGDIFLDDRKIGTVEPEYGLVTMEDVAYVRGKLIISPED